MKPKRTAFARDAMPNKKKGTGPMKKMLFDTVMAVLLVLLMDTLTTGLLLHEVIGLLLGLLFIVHKFVNFRWIKSVALRLFDPALKKKTKFMFALDFLLLLCVTATVVTGIGISREVFGLAEANGSLALWTALHHGSAYGSLVLISVHIGLHWSGIMAVSKKLFGVVRRSRASAVLARVVAVCIMLWGIKASVERDVAGNLAEPFTVGGEGAKAAGNVITGYETETVSARADTKQTPKITALSVTQTAASQSLEDYLSKLICTGCSRRCPLSRPQCSKGEARATAATTEYYQKYAASSGTADSGSTSSKPSGGSSGDSASSQPGAAGSADSSQGGAASSSQAANDGASYPAEGAKTAGAQESSPLLGVLSDFIPIMGLFIGGTHYAMLLPKKLVDLLFE